MATALKILVFITVVMQVHGEAQLTKMIRNCRINHVERLNECIVSAVMAIRPEMAKGIPELNLPPMDPYDMPPVEFVRTEGGVRVKAYYDNLTIQGFSRAEIKYFDWHFKQRKLFMGAVFPSILIKGRYNITGRIFALPIEGNGAYTSLLKGVILESESNLGQGSDGKLFLKDFTLDFKIQDSQTKMDNLFNGNRVLSETMEHFLKENDGLIMEEIRPAIQKTWSNLLGAVLKAFINSLPGDITSIIENENINDKHRKRTNEIQAGTRRRMIYN